MVTMQTYEMVIRTVNKHKRVVISCPRAVMAVFDIIYPEIRGHVNRFLLYIGLPDGGIFLLEKEFHWLEIVHR